MTTRLFQSRWVVLFGVLAAIGIMVSPALADHHHYGGRVEFGHRHFAPYYGYGYYQPYYTAPYPYYYPQVVAPYAPYYPYYYGGGYGYGYARPGWGVHVRIR